MHHLHFSPTEAVTEVLDVNSVFKEPNERWAFWFQSSSILLFDWFHVSVQKVRKVVMMTQRNLQTHFSFLNQKKDQKFVKCFPKT